MRRKRITGSQEGRKDAGEYIQAEKEAPAPWKKNQGEK